MIIDANGKRRKITKRKGFTKQLLNKAISGHLGAARLVLPRFSKHGKKPRKDSG